jgi:membrane associated rhomboid family serine protease
MFPLYDLNPHHRFPWVTVLLILANVVVMTLQGLEPSEQTVYHYGFIPKRVTELQSGTPIPPTSTLPSSPPCSSMAAGSTLA